MESHTTVSYAEATLKPLDVAEHIVKYRENGYPLQYYAACITPMKSEQPLPSDGFTLIFLHALGLAIGTYYPMFQKLFALQDRSDSPFKICAVWMLEGANHNDSAVMNEHILKSHFANEFPIRYHAHGILAFMKSGLVDTSNPNLVTVSHCGASGVFAVAVDSLLRSNSIRLRSMIMIEPTLFDQRVQTNLIEYAQRRDANKKSEIKWRNLDEAMTYFKKRHPWNTWDEEILTWMRATAFRPSPESTKLGGKTLWVTTKTSVEQESASFEPADALLAAKILLGIFPRVPVHIVMSEGQNAWTKPIYANMAEVLAKQKPLLASFRVVSGIGHWIPHDSPSKAASAIFDALVSEVERLTSSRHAWKETSKL